MTNPVDQARQYLADGKNVLWTDVDIRPMVEGLLEELEYYKPPPFKPSDMTYSIRSGGVIGSGIIMVAHGGGGGNGGSGMARWETDEEFKERMRGLQNTAPSDSLNVRMADIREEGPSLLRRIKNWWRNK
jgi:hypothetical protein